MKKTVFGLIFGACLLVTTSLSLLAANFFESESTQVNTRVVRYDAAGNEILHPNNTRVTVIEGCDELGTTTRTVIEQFDAGGTWISTHEIGLDLRLFGEIESMSFSETGEFICHFHLWIEDES